MEAAEQWIRTSLAPQLEPKGYHWLGRLHQFRREHDDGFTCLILSCSPYEDTCLVEAHVGLRIHEVEEMVFSFTNGVPGFRPDSMTLVTPLARLYQESYQRYEVDGPASAATVAQTLLAQMTERGFPFLGKYRDVPMLNGLYNDTPSEPVPALHNQINRCFRGLVLAKLVQRPHLGELAAMYEQVLERHHAPAQRIQQFQRLTEYLQGYHPN